MYRAVTSYMKPCERQFASRNVSEGVELRKIQRRIRAKDFIFWKPESVYAQIKRCISRISTPIMRESKGEYISASRSLSPQRVNEKDYVGTWENHIVPFRSRKQAAEVRMQYVNMVVGLTYSRGVNRVMPIEFTFKSTRRGQQLNVKG